MKPVQQFRRLVIASKRVNSNGRSANGNQSNRTTTKRDGSNGQTAQSREDSERTTAYRDSSEGQSPDADQTGRYPTQCDKANGDIPDGNDSLCNPEFSGNRIDVGPVEDMNQRKAP